MMRPTSITTSHMRLLHHHHRGRLLQTPARRQLSTGAAPANNGGARGVPMNVAIGTAVAGAALFMLVGRNSKETNNNTHAKEEKQHAQPQTQQPATTPTAHDEAIQKAIVELLTRLDSLETALQEANRKAAVEQVANELLSHIQQHAMMGSESGMRIEHNETDVTPTGAPSAIDADVAKQTNRAFLFVKPHAFTPAVVELVKTVLEGKKINIISSGFLTGPEIDERKLIDQHYYAIASKAVILKPTELIVSNKGKDLFAKAFGMKWEDALAQGLVYNAKDACVKLEVDGDTLEKMYRDIDKSQSVKFGGGFYCGKVKDIFIINPFYMQMRDKYVAPNVKLHWLEVEWPNSNDSVSWKSFRDEVLGTTDPSKAKVGSLRRLIFDNWTSLGLSAKPDTGDNGMHGSASPFEAVAEVNNWLSRPLSQDFYGRGMLAATNMSEAALKTWLADAAVIIESGKPAASIFDALEDTNADECLDKLVVISSNNRAIATL